MAILKESLSGYLSGKIGNVVICKMNGKTYVRSLPAHPNNPNTPAQQRVRTRFAAVGRFYQCLKKTPLHQVWKSIGKWKTKSPHSFFISVNLESFDYEGYLSGFSRLCLSMGPLHPSFFEIPERIEENVYRIRWNNEAKRRHCCPDDRLMVVALYPEDSFSPLLLDGIDVCRKEGVCDIALPAPGAVHLYLFFGSGDGTLFSDNTYFYLS